MTPPPGLVVGALQLDIAWELPEENFRRAAELAARAAASGARLLVLPEMFATGFSMNADETSRHEPACREFLGSIARRHEAWVAAGVVTGGAESPANSCLLFDPDGDERLRYDKVHPFTMAGEAERYVPGERLRTIDVDGLRVTPLVCYDLRFGELFRAAASTTDLFVVIANWPARRGHAWRTLLAARAIDCLAWVLGVNRVGEAKGVPHPGDSMLVDPVGEVVSRLHGQEGVVVASVDAETVARARDRYPFLDDRRPDVYRRLDARTPERLLPDAEELRPARRRAGRE